MAGHSTLDERSAQGTKNNASPASPCEPRQEKPDPTKNGTEPLGFPHVAQLP